MSRTNRADRDEHALPDLTGEDEVHSEPTKVGDGAVAVREAFRAALETPGERATSKMSPFQLESVLERLADAPEKSQSRMRAPSVPPPISPPADNASERATVPGPMPAEVVPAVLPEVSPQGRAIERDLPGDERTGGVSIGLVLLAVVFFVLTCGVLFGR